MKKGPKETALQAMREAACKLDHEHGLPKFLCVKCNPRPKQTAKEATVVAQQEKRRDFRIPKGMSTEEGEAMLAERAAKKTEATKQAIETLTTKQRDELARINALRHTNGLPALPEKFQRQMKADSASNEMMFARAEVKLKPKAKMESKMNTTTEKKAPAKKAAAKTKPAVAAKTASKKKAAAAARTKVSKPSEGGKRRGAFTDEVTTTIMGMLKKGTTIKDIVTACKWEKAADPVRRVHRFLTDVARDELKAKVEVTGRGEEAAVVLK